MSEVLAGLPNAQLLERVRELVRRGNAVEAELLVHLAEVDARQLYLEEGCSSMFTYCQRVLHFAEGVAYKRIQAARAARRHPQILDALRSGDLHLTAVGLLAPKLTASNCAELIGAARNLGADEIRRMLADREPKPAVPTLVRRIAEISGRSTGEFDQGRVGRIAVLPLTARLLAELDFSLAEALLAAARFGTARAAAGRRGS